MWSKYWPCWGACVQYAHSYTKKNNRKNLKGEGMCEDANLWRTASYTYKYTRLFVINSHPRTVYCMTKYFRKSLCTKSLPNFPIFLFVTVWCCCTVYIMWNLQQLIQLVLKSRAENWYKTKTNYWTRQHETINLASAKALF